jgi:hypothetical protein
VTAVKGQVVQVAFQVAAIAGQTNPTLPSVTIPIATSYYDWLPVRVGDTGVAVSADAYLGGISGLGGGVASLARPGNLTALVFLPVAHASWSVPDATQRVVQGAGGVLVRDTSNHSSINTTPEAITMICQGHTLVMNATGLVFDGIVFGTHAHDQGNDSHGDTEQRTTGPVNP